MPHVIPMPRSADESTLFHAALTDRRRRLEDLSTHTTGHQVAALLETIDAALERLESDSFGVCSRCRGSIEIERLIEEPLTTVCLDCLSSEERSALERDLNLASRVQAQMLPPADLDGDGWSGHYYYQPHGPVSGDYVDIVPPRRPGGDTHVLVGDVSGKGVAAALLMSQLHALIRSAVEMDESLEEMLNRANRMLVASSPENTFATLVAARLGCSGEVVLCSAGHTPAMLLTASDTTPLPNNGLPLGLFSEARYETQSLHLGTGESLVLYTDGVTEATDPSGRELGIDGLQSALATSFELSAYELVQRARWIAESHSRGKPKHDDLTVLAVKKTA